MKKVAWVLSPAQIRIIRQDRVAAISLSAAVLLNLALFVMVAVIAGRLQSAAVPLHFDRLGQVNRVGPPASLFVLPIIGLASWLMNALPGWFFYQVRGERPVAYVVWAGTVVVQVATWVALVGLLTAM